MPIGESIAHEANAHRTPCVLDGLIGRIAENCFLFPVEVPDRFMNPS